MRQGRLGAIFAAAAVLAALPAYGQAKASSRAGDERALEAARNRLATQASLTKGAAQQSFDLERRHIDDLISALQSGQPVSATEIERALERARQLP